MDLLFFFGKIGIVAVQSNNAEINLLDSPVKQTLMVNQFSKENTHQKIFTKVLKCGNELRIVSLKFLQLNK